VGLAAAPDKAVRFPQALALWDKVITVVAPLEAAVVARVLRVRETQAALALLRQSQVPQSHALAAAVVGLAMLLSIQVAQAAVVMGHQVLHPQ
jgi:hypothetical protein